MGRALWLGLPHDYTSGGHKDPPEMRPRPRDRLGHCGRAAEGCWTRGSRRCGGQARKYIHLWIKCRYNCNKL